MEAIHQKCKRYELKNIYSVDKTGFQRKLTPKRTNLSIYEDQETARGTDDMHYKDRVSAFMCTKGPGTDKVDMTKQLNGTYLEKVDVSDDEK